MLPKRIFKFFILFVLLQAFLLKLNYTTSATTLALEGFDILLGRPTDDSITVNVIPDQSGEISFEVGTTSGVYGSPTDATACTVDEPVEVVIDGLSANTQYYYRLRFRAAGETEWTTGEEHSFRTQRSPGETFTFTIISDSHLGQYGGVTADELALYEQTLLNVGSDDPDFHIDLGDTFPMDPSPLGTGMTEQEAEAAYLYQRPYFSLIDRSVPIYLVIGNHENEEGWNFDDVFTPPDQSLALVGMKYRKTYYPNPVPDDFYSGNIDPLPDEIGGDTFHEDYYAWEWGDALFVVLDPYHYSMTWPNEDGGYGGEGQDGEASGDRWDWTLGIEQYLWLKDTLENSDATYKFVFSHHVTGGATSYGRGGISAAPYFEWGGKNADETWGWDTERPASDGWDVPIHQLMVINGVDVFIHGHDHIYAYEELDGMVYLEVPKPDDAGYDWSPYGYGYTEDLYPDGLMIQNSGHIRVTVSPTEATFEYVRSYLPGDGTNGVVAHSFIIPATSTTHLLTMAVDPAASGTTDPSVGVHVYAEGAVVNVTATAATGYLFDSWSGDCEEDGACQVTMDGDKNVTANFIPSPCYALTLSHTGNGSDPVASPENSTNCDAGQYVAGQIINLNGANPASGWQISGWSGTENDASTYSTNTVNMPAGAHEASVIYSEMCYLLTISHTGSGSNPVALPTNSSGCATNYYHAGEIIGLSGADPANGWEISGWNGTDDNASTESTNTVTMPASTRAASVNYSEIPPTCYALTLSHSGEGTDPVASPTNSTGCDAGEYVAGQYINLSGADPESGWLISGWSGTTNNASTLDTNIVTMPANAHDASVIYSEIPPACYLLTLSHTGQGSNPVASPSNSPGCSSGTYVAGESISLSGAVPGSGWEISSWSGTDDNASTEDTNTVTMPASTRAASVNYSEIPVTCYALTLSHSGEGSDPVASPPNSTGCEAGQYVADENITLSGADPASGWQISGWSGTMNDSSTMDTNMVNMPAGTHEASVIYSEISAPTCYALTLSHSGEGTDPVASPTNSTGCSAGTYVEDESITLSGAVPANGWQISGWSGTDDNSSTTDTNIVTMPASAHTASVAYKAYIYLPALFDSSTSEATDLALMSAASLSNPDYTVLENPSLKGMLKQIGSKP